MSQNISVLNRPLVYLATSLNSKYSLPAKLGECIVDQLHQLQCQGKVDLKAEKIYPDKKAHETRVNDDEVTHVQFHLCDDHFLMAKVPAQHKDAILLKVW